MYGKKFPKHIEERIRKYKIDDIMNKYYNIHIYKNWMTKEWVISFISKT